MRHILAVIILILILVIPWLMAHPDQAGLLYSVIGAVEDKVAAVILTHKPRSVSEIQAKYNSNGSYLGFGTPSNKVRILLVPGHEPAYGGAQYNSLYERDMAVDLANVLHSYLQSDGRYQVYVTRGKSSWDPTFDNYFKTYWDEIGEWQKAYKNEVIHLTRLGEFKQAAPSIIHNDAPDDIARRLYGISKWGNENNIDIAIHIHFNDYPRRNKAVPGRYSGFTIYVPEKQYFNSSTTRAVAETIFQRLGRYNPVSNLNGESEGIVEDPDLIATGAYNSVDAASMLIEYGYIYEPQFTNDMLRDQAIKDLAYGTYLGLQDFFKSSGSRGEASYDTTILPRNWTSPMDEKTSNVADIYAIQTALVVEGSYPPSGNTLNDCPRTGKFGLCTKAAVTEFQNKRGIVGESGAVGPKTLIELNKLFNVKVI